MPKRKPTQKKTFSEALQAFVARRLVDGVSLGFVLIGAFVLLALLSYDPADPSWNSAAASDDGIIIQNWMGGVGAWVADLFIQMIGLGGIVFGLIPLIWGARLFLRQSLSPFWARVLALLASVGLVTAALGGLLWGGNIDLPNTYGGFLGALVFSSSLSVFLDVLPRFTPWIIFGVYMVGGLIGFLFAAAVTKNEISFVLEKTLLSLQILLNVLYAAFQKFMAWLRHYNDPDYVPPPLKLFEFGNKFKQSRPIRVPSVPRELPKAPEIPVDDIAAEPSALAVSSSASIPVVKQENKTINPASSQTRFALDGAEMILPDIDLLEEPDVSAADRAPDERALRQNAALLQNVLADFKIDGEVVSIHPGPVVTLYELEPAPGVKSSRVIGLSDDIARSMAAVSVRCAVVPGRNVIGIELPNKARQIVYMKELLTSKEFEKTKMKLPLVLGKDIAGQNILADLAKMPHLLVAGTTGSGKSVAVNSMILSLVFALPPEKCRFIMIDPKMLELSVYDDIPHLLSPVVTEPGKAVVALKWTVQEMEERYRAMSKLGVRNIDGYNERLKEAREKGETIMQKVQTGFDPDTGKPIYEEQEMDLTELPYIVVIVDEFADLMLVAGKDVENAIQRLAQMARAAGIHIIMATQRPSVDVITGVIKANFPTRISFQVTSKIDSRTILGDGGAEQLLGMGDMLYMAPGGQIKRIHGPFVSDDDVEKVVADLKSQGEPAYLTDVTNEENMGEASEVMNAIFADRDGVSPGGNDKVDELYDQAVAIVAREQKASTSFIQRHLQIGYNRAARIVEEMERQGVISPANATGKRNVLINDVSEY